MGGTEGKEEKEEEEGEEGDEGEEGEVSEKKAQSHVNKFRIFPIEFTLVPIGFVPQKHRDSVVCDKTN